MLNDIKIQLAHSRLPMKWNGLWIYIGNNYLRMREWQQRLGKSQISLSGYIKDQAEQKRPDFLEWLEKQRKANHDSLYWWMTHLAGRNTARSQLALYIFQISALREFLLNYTGSEKNILVVCEDGFLLYTVRQNLVNDWVVRTNSGCWLGFGRDWAWWLARAGWSILRQIHWFWRHYRIARATRPAHLNLPEGEVFLIHLCLDDKPLLRDGPLTSRYFKLIPEWLEQQGKQVVRLPWFANVSLPLKEVYEKFRESNCLIPEDWLQFRDYLVALWNSILAAFSLRSDIPFPGLNLTFLLMRERLDQLGCTGAAAFWRYIPMLKRWGCKLDSLIALDHFEGIFFEHIQIQVGRQLPFRFFAIGYYHTIVTKDMLAYHFHPDEWSSKVMPDRVVTNGALSQELLIRQGVPPEKVVSGPALRQEFPSLASKGNKGDSLLILLSLSQSSFEILVKLSQHRDWLQDVLKVPIIIKKHPFSKKKKLLKILGWKQLPDGWKWFDDEIYLAIEHSYCVVAIATGSVVDAVIGGAVVVPLTQELNTPWNYLDLLEDEFPVVKAIHSEKIPQRLEEIYFTRREYYQAEFAKVRQRLIDGLNPVSDGTLRMFLPDKQVL